MTAELNDEEIFKYSEQYEQVSSTLTQSLYFLALNKK